MWKEVCRVGRRAGDDSSSLQDSGPRSTPGSEVRKAGMSRGLDAALVVAVRGVRVRIHYLISFLRCW